MGYISLIKLCCSLTSIYNKLMFSMQNYPYSEFYCKLNIFLFDKSALLQYISVYNMTPIMFFCGFHRPFWLTASNSLSPSVFKIGTDSFSETCQNINASCLSNKCTITLFNSIPKQDRQMPLIGYKQERDKYRTNNLRHHWTLCITDKH